MSMKVKPVFLDESGRRWKVVRPVLLAGAATLVAIPIGLILSIQNVSVGPQNSSGAEEPVLGQATERPYDRIALSAARPWRITRKGNVRVVRHEQ
jgi:hypothetical protein